MHFLGRHEADYFAGQEANHLSETMRRHDLAFVRSCLCAPFLETFAQVCNERREKQVKECAVVDTVMSRGAVDEPGRVGDNKNE